ncbi:diphosphomevalonate decarboxylase [Silvanigrella aquatica]|uniref:diphosphomevalonate decarboxylase n=1 Tax=Silvanigrella aquatica TaxID=1915309 RepID=A0A1L4CYS8_9BACT|nr:diphosphomevalonate decarboxylase [Silvanigrella aquatica]APJ03090.1 diphosphomevalonate decarboxylase [Silvanigrella aquatica]
MNQNLITDIPASLKKLQNKILELKIAEKIIIQNGDLGYASAPSNIALLKYWGKTLGREQIPINSSISYTLGGFRSFTKVTALGRFFPDEIKSDALFSNQLILKNKNNEIIQIPHKMDRLIKSILFPFGKEIYLKIDSYNNFPTACGIASSASGYAALVAAIADLLQLQIHFTEQELKIWLTEWSRLGSGSATRSALTGDDKFFVKWETPSDHKIDFSETQNLKYHPKWRTLQHVVFILDSNEKSTSSSEGHKFAETSPFHKIRVAGIPSRMKLMEKGLQEFDFDFIQYLSEEDAYSMHAVMQTGEPKACYLNNETAEIISIFVKLRNKYEAKAFWTLDAGPNLHVLFMPDSLSFVQEFHQIAQKFLNRKINNIVNNFNESLIIGRSEYERIENRAHLTTTLS